MHVVCVVHEKRSDRIERAGFLLDEWSFFRRQKVDSQQFNTHAQTRIHTHPVNLNIHAHFTLIRWTMIRKFFVNLGLIHCVLQPTCSYGYRSSSTLNYEKSFFSSLLLFRHLDANNHIMLRLQQILFTTSLYKPARCNLQDDSRSIHTLLLSFNNVFLTFFEKILYRYVSMCIRVKYTEKT